MKYKGFEFEDQRWFPSAIREGMTDYLRVLFHTLNLYKPVIPLLDDAIERNRTNKVIDLCSGSGGTIEKIRQNFLKMYSNEVKFTLTDRFPNTKAYQFVSARSNWEISYVCVPVDAANVPETLTGFRTIFSSFHHFTKEQAKAVIKNAVRAKQGIGIFDGGNRNVLMILAILIFHPLLMLLFTPFFKPFKWSRLIFTYILPIIPFCTVWDGVFSILSLYSPAELLAIAKEADYGRYHWKAGKVRNRYGMSIAYLIGLPSESSNLQSSSNFG